MARLRRVGRRVNIKASAASLSSRPPLSSASRRSIVVGHSAYFGDRLLVSARGSRCSTPRANFSGSALIPTPP
jgi:hypothetical protein